jgi:hypothetical protein
MSMQTSLPSSGDNLCSVTLVFWVIKSIAMCQFYVLKNCKMRLMKRDSLTIGSLVESVSVKLVRLDLVSQYRTVELKFTICDLLLSFLN